MEVRLERGQATFFTTPAKFTAWLETHHNQSRELWVGFQKKGSGLPSITWPEAVDEALCFGWIDGVRKSLRETRCVIRFTRRQSRSAWSAVNFKRVQELLDQGRMRPAGFKAFQDRTEEKSRIYSYEQGEVVALGEADERQFRANRTAWDFFQAQAATYRKAAI